MTEDWLRPSRLSRLTGAELFEGLDATVGEFWSWAFSDLRDNTTRGVLAEFLVAKAVGGSDGVRVGWDNYDVTAPDGTAIEVKCSAFLQSWAQKEHSKLSFGRLRAREFDASINEYSIDAKVRADVFAFAVQTQLDPAAYDMLDMAHWEFWVVDGSTISEQVGKTVGIRWVQQHGVGPLRHEALAQAIAVAAGAGER